MSLPYFNSGNIIKNSKVIDMDSKKLNIYGRIIGEEVLSEYKKMIIWLI